MWLNFEIKIIQEIFFKIFQDQNLHGLSDLKIFFAREEHGWFSSFGKNEVNSAVLINSWEDRSPPIWQR